MIADKLIVALDAPNLAQAERLVKKLTPLVKTFKIGKELFTVEGPAAVDMVRKNGARVFLDLKFHDIPNTVAGACRAAATLGAWMMNVHASGGRQMLREAAAVSPRPLLLGVTVLTSLKDADLAEIGLTGTASEAALRLARLVKACGLDGVVASGGEIGPIRAACGGDFLIVVPGVRPSWAEAGDQKRIVTPLEALRRGADYLIVGRPITGKPDPLGAAQAVIDEMARA